MTERSPFVALLLFALFIPQTVRAEDNENQAFHAWSGFAVGSSETIEGSIDTGHGEAVSTTTTKLIERADDHLVVETTQSMVLAGTSHSIPPQKTTIQPAPEPAKVMTQIATEDVVAAGRTFSCKVYVPTHPRTDSKIQLKVWACSDVPGGVVKVEISTPDRKIVQTLKSFESK